MNKVTIRDIAKAAGVSYVTVSNVINEKGNMAEKTRLKVLSYIKKMNFHPNEIARTLVSGKTNTIAYVSKYLGAPFTASILMGVERQLFDTGNSAMNLVHYSTKETMEKEEKLMIDMIYGGKADAVIMQTIKPSLSRIKEFKKAGIPLVLIENDAASGACSIKVDNYKGAYAAVTYLIKKGRKKINVIDWLFSIPKEAGVRENFGVKERVRAYRDALKDNGIEYESTRAYTAKYFNPEEGIRLMDLMMKNSRDTDAVFCAAGDLVAIGLMHRAKQLGLNIPGDLSVMGFDDVQVAEYLTPALTTVRQPLEAMGRKAFDLSFDMLNGKIKGMHEVLIIPELIIRGSV